MTTTRPVRGISRDTLLTVAAGLFARRGYRATTIDDIAAELGLKKASLYHYIGSKDDLLAEMYRRLFDRIHEAVAPHAALDLPADERLRRMVHAHLEVVMDERDLLAVVFREESELPPRSQRDIGHRKRAHEALFEGVIEEGQQAGVLRPISPRLMVLALLGMCNWVYQWYRPDRYSTEAVAAAFAAMAESGWLAGEASGAWPRYTSVAEAMDPIRASLDGTRAELERLQTAVDRADERLQAGLAGTRGRPSAVVQRRRSEPQQGLTTSTPAGRQTRQRKDNP